VRANAFRTNATICAAPLASRSWSGSEIAMLPPTQCADVIAQARDDAKES
jgi:hypothetical protein